MIGLVISGVILQIISIVLQVVDLLYRKRDKNETTP